MSLYLADSSIWVSRRRPGAEHVQRQFLERFRRGEVATCIPVALEVLQAQVDATSYERDWERVWEALFWLPLGERATQRALDVQRGLTWRSGSHRCTPVPFLVAACAEAAGDGVVLWHSDPDLVAICEYTGQTHEYAHDLALASVK